MRQRPNTLFRHAGRTIFQLTGLGVLAFIFEKGFVSYARVPVRERSIMELKTSNELAKEEQILEAIRLGEIQASEVKMDTFEQDAARERKEAEVRAAFRKQIHEEQKQHEAELKAKASTKSD